MNNLRQIRCRSARNRRTDVAARQALYRRRGGLDGLLHLAAGAEPAFR
ncbi:hypothetical protein [Erwinia amylovora]